MEVWETPEKLEAERELREQKREKAKINKFNKQVKSKRDECNEESKPDWIHLVSFTFTALRMAVRSSVYKKQTAGHQHDYGAETYDAERDLYFRTCSTCTHRQEYEKM